mmetsp:Transcript_50830/g.145231  ORF Transcript_50830/g.145231 Transcript_50830/m.145231 type:complete len:225 (+) Transcript_50830:164-838(+)
MPARQPARRPRGRWPAPHPRASPGKLLRVEPHPVVGGESPRLADEHLRPTGDDAPGRRVTTAHHLAQELGQVGPPGAQGHGPQLHRLVLVPGKLRCAARELGAAGGGIARCHPADLALQLRGLVARPCTVPGVGLLWAWAHGPRGQLLRDRAGAGLDLGHLRLQPVVRVHTSCPRGRRAPLTRCLARDKYMYGAMEALRRHVWHQCREPLHRLWAPHHPHKLHP